MEQIPCTVSNIELKKIIGKLDNTVCRYTEHNNLLNTYKNNKKTPKGLQLKFNLSLCPGDKQLIKEVGKCLRQCSYRIQESLIKANVRHIEHTKAKRDSLVVDLKKSISDNLFNQYMDTIKSNTDNLRQTIQNRHKNKMFRDSINVTENGFNTTNKKRRFSKYRRKQFFKSRRQKLTERLQLRKAEAISKTPDQNAINLTDYVLNDSEKSLLIKGPSFIPTPSDINWQTLRHDFDKFAHKLRYQVSNQYHNIDNVPKDKSLPPYKPETPGRNYRGSRSKSNCFEAFVEAVEKDIFNPNNIRKGHQNLTVNEKNAMQNIISWEDKTVRLQDKGGRFVVLSNDDYCSKVEEQIARSFLTEVESNLSSTFEGEVNQWIEKWTNLRKLPKEWSEFIKPTDSKPGDMYGLIKTHKPNNTNPARTISSGCGTAVENLSIFVETHLAPLAETLPSRIKDSSHMLDIIDELNNNGLPTNCILASLDVVNMFPNIDNTKGIQDVKAMLNLRPKKDPPTTCLIEALLLCLQCNNSSFNNKQHLQTDGTAQGPHMSCSYSDIAMARYDEAATDTNPAPLVWFRFRDDIFLIWIFALNELEQFVDYVNNLDNTGKIKFELTTGTDEGLNFLDLNLKFNKDTGRIEVNVYAKPTNSFTYVDPNTCYTRRNINKIPYGIALRIRRICDDDTKFEQKSEEYQNYLIARNYKPSKVKNQFDKVRKITRAQARQPKPRTNNDITKNAFITHYNPMIPDLYSIFQKHINILHVDPEMKKNFHLVPLNPFIDATRTSKNYSLLLHFQKQLAGMYLVQTFVEYVIYVGTTSFKVINLNVQ